MIEVTLLFFALPADEVERVCQLTYGQATTTESATILTVGLFTLWDEALSAAAEAVRDPYVASRLMGVSITPQSTRWVQPAII